MIATGWGKKKKDQGRHGRYSEEVHAELSTNFTRGTTLSTFHSTEREKSDRQKEHDLRTWRRKLSGILIIIVIICGLGVLILTQFSGSIASINSNTPMLKATDADRYRKIVNEYLSRNPFERFDFARRNDNLTNYVAGQAPEVKSVKISQAGILLGKLSMDFRKPVAVWRTAEQTSYVDASGVVFMRNYFETPSVTITDNNSTVIDSGTVASSRFLGFVGRVVAELSRNGNTVERVVIPTGAIRYVEFYLEGRNYPFKAQIDRDPVGQVADIVAMTRYLDTNRIVPSYVDTRVAGKAYWQ